MHRRGDMPTYIRKHITTEAILTKASEARRLNKALGDRKALDHDGDGKPFAIKSVPEGLLQLTFVVVMTT
jgi:hypothetical protein